MHAQEPRVLPTPTPPCPESYTPPAPQPFEESHYYIPNSMILWKGLAGSHGAQGGKHTEGRRPQFTNHVRPPLPAQHQRCSSRQKRKPPHQYMHLNSAREQPSPWALHSTRTGPTWESAGQHRRSKGALAPARPLPSADASHAETQPTSTVIKPT